MLADLGKGLLGYRRQPLVNGGKHCSASRLRQQLPQQGVFLFEDIGRELTNIWPRGLGKLLRQDVWLEFLVEIGDAADPENRLVHDQAGHLLRTTRDETLEAQDAVGSKNWQDLDLAR